MTEHYHRQMYLKAKEHALTKTELVALCQVVAGTVPQKLTPDQAHLVLTTMVSKGDELKKYALEMARTL